ncbi:MAG: hypothetical protein ABG776_22370, partial [Cyanobacteria bacterium J06555_13]
SKAILGSEPLFLNAWEYRLSDLRNSSTKNFSYLPFTGVNWIDNSQLNFLQQTNLLMGQVKEKHQLINQYVFWLSSAKKYQESTLVRNKVATPKYFDSYGQWLIDYPLQFALHLTRLNLSMPGSVVIFVSRCDHLVSQCATLVFNWATQLASDFLVLLFIAFIRQRIILMKRLKTEHLKTLQKIIGGTAWTFACLTKPLVLVLKNAAWRIRYAFLSMPLASALGLKAQYLL